MLWLKAFHIIFVVTWFAGLFYLPRLFVYDVEASEPEFRLRLRIMQRRLLMITHIGGALAVAFGIALMGWWMKNAPQALTTGAWFHLKLLLVVGLIAYHGMLMRLTRQLANDRCTRSSRWLRLFNEIPAVLLIAIVILVVVKPI
ncbi:CopD family protein [Dokdonella sp.]|uniref:CopD family protein n=1 Tax=Dokdonella sp. TaxID=2291710 RepID=UPI003C5DF6FA